MAITQDDDGLVLILNQFSSKLAGFTYPESFDILHVGFILETRDAVDAIHARLTADGWEPQPPRNMHGAWAFYVRARGGYFIEVTTPTPIRPEEAWQGSNGD